MKTILLSLLVSLNAMAYQDISCWDGDCFNNGWTQTEPFANTFSDFQCYRDGCLKSGWIVGGNENLHYYTQCKPEGCFSEGWYEVDRNTHALLGEVQCVDSSCLTAGWFEYRSGITLRTECESNDCKSKGWRSQKPGGHHAFVYCKSNSCFTEGWIESFQ